MPKVTLCHIARIPASEVWDLAEELAKIVAEVMHIEEVLDAHLKPENICVVTEALGNRHHNFNDISIVVEANEFKIRLENVSRYEELIKTGMWMFLTNGYAHHFTKDSKIAVWVRLAPGAYGEYPILG